MEKEKKKINGELDYFSETVANIIRENKLNMMKKIDNYYQSYVN